MTALLFQLPATHQVSVATQLVPGIHWLSSVASQPFPTAEPMSSTKIPSSTDATRTLRFPTTFRHCHNIIPPSSDRTMPLNTLPPTSHPPPPSLTLTNPPIPVQMAPHNHLPQPHQLPALPLPHPHPPTALGLGAALSPVSL